ncbi:MAG: TadE/TadG family type IV pilus assembly protein [Pseudomonadota bacterium]
MFGAFRQYLTNEDGNASIEFVILFPFFMFLFMSIVEMGFLTTRAVLLERGLDMAARDVRLDLIQDLDHEKLKNRICELSTILVYCLDDMFLELKVFDKNDPYPQNAPSCQDRTARGSIDPKTEFNPGGRSEIMFIRACLVVDPLVPGLGIGLLLPRDASGGYQLVSYTAFVNEPN